MTTGGGNMVSECTPAEAWRALEADPKAQLVDVRTRPEWSFVGIPDISALGRQAVLCEWRAFPAMQVNPVFAQSLEDQFGAEAPTQIFFLCRSGARSMEAAHTIRDHYAAKGVDVACINVAEGFEGDLDPDRHRGTYNGWKARGLAWQQS